jgi:predicted glycogen debranching enzyme
MNDLAAMKNREWLEADGLGGFASGTELGVRTRRYHALLLAATKPPSGRVVLVNGFEAWIETAGGVFYLSSQIYDPGVLSPGGCRRISAFKAEPWPQWTFTLEDNTRLQYELFAVKGAAIVAFAWRLLTPGGKAVLTLRPLLSGRDYHALHHENSVFRFEPEFQRDRVIWRPYRDLPGIIAVSNGGYFHQPEWYRSFLYEEERARGLDCVEDLAAPGLIRWELSMGEAVGIFAAEGFENNLLPTGARAEKLLADLRAREFHRREIFSSSLDRAADSYLVQRGKGKTIVAGYPWFTDWGRDTFMALRGLCLATGRHQDARDILIEWAQVVSEGMLPNRFPDQGDTPEYNSVDASLWYVIAAHELMEAMKGSRQRLTNAQEGALRAAIEAILEGYANGTRYGIHMDQDALLAAGEPGVQLTWMDVKIGDWVVTPRIGKPVEVQALWVNALWIGSQSSARWKEPLARARESFGARFWNGQSRCLYDNVDVDHQAGQVDPSFRPNQIFAVGGLPMAVIEGERARRVVAAVEHRLWTPMGLRSLASEEQGYAARYDGGAHERDAGYHQGTVWPWLIGPFVEAWVRVRGGTAAAKHEARSRFLAPLLEHLNRAGIGHVSEIADAEAPHAPRGCPFQAWSLGELLRLDRRVLVDSAAAAAHPKGSE